MSAASAHIARKAADLIEQGGLADRRLVDYPAYCLVGALRAAQHGDPQQEFKVIWGTAPEVRKFGGIARLEQSLMRYSDRPGTTAADVVALLRKVADEVDEPEGDAA